MRRLFLSFLGAGYLRPAPGTWGSLAALPAAWLLHHLGGPLLLVFLTAAFYGLAVRLIAVDMRETGTHDPSWIVIDEIIGQWIALLPVSIGAAQAGVPVTALWPGIVSAFLLVPSLRHLETLAGGPGRCTRRCHRRGAG